MTKKPQQITIFPDMMREDVNISKLIEQIAQKDTAAIGL